jgi:outer membrane protein assembly factor BamE (lipoprotein component of BamABCDE complex)
MTRRFAALFATLTSILVLGCKVESQVPQTPTRAFDSTVWREADPSQEKDRGVRGSMVDDLIAQKFLDGMTATEVEQLLGDPLSDGALVSAGMDNEYWQLGYHLGPAKDFLPIDEQFLMLRLDNAGKVIEYRVVPN